MKRSSPGVCRDSDIERYKASRLERAEAMREIVRIIARIMRKKRARRSRNSTTVSKKQGRIGTRYTSVRVTTMHSNDSNLSGNYFDSTCICIVERTRSISLSLSPSLFKRGQRRRGNDSPSLLTSRLVLPKKRERIRRDFPRFHVEPDSVDLGFFRSRLAPSDREPSRLTSN